MGAVHGASTCILTRFEAAAAGSQEFTEGGYARRLTLVFLDMLQRDGPIGLNDVLHRLGRYVGACVRIKLILVLLESFFFNFNFVFKMHLSTFVFWLRMGLDRVVLVQWLEFGNDSFEKIYFSFEALLLVLVVHKFKHVTELLEDGELVTCESKVAAELSHAHWTDSERLVVSFIQLA